MLGNFEYQNPTKIIFGEGSIKNLKVEADKYGDNVLLVYGGGSIKSNGIYDQVIGQLKGKNIIEFSGVMSNPTADKLREGAKLVRDNNIDLILAVGGGSVCDISKALAAAKECPGDIWDYLYEDNEEPDWELLPVGCVVTMSATGSEMNSVAVIMNTETHVKKGHHFTNGAGFPKFSILDPRFTMSLPKYQMVSGIYDIFNHLSEQYFAGDDNNANDYMIEGLMRCVVHASRVAINNPEDYEARSNIMWAATCALNDMFKMGNKNDFMIHKLGHAVAAYTNAAHGMSLSAVSMAYYRYIMPYGLDKFVKFAKYVWSINPSGLTDEQIAVAGLDAMESWMKEIGVVMNLSQLDVTESMINDIVNSVIILKNGYKVLDKSEVELILRKSL